RHGSTTCGSSRCSSEPATRCSSPSTSASSSFPRPSWASAARSVPRRDWSISSSGWGSTTRRWTSGWPGRMPRGPSCSGTGSPHRRNGGSRPGSSGGCSGERLHQGPLGDPDRALPPGDGEREPHPPRLASPQVPPRARRLPSGPGALAHRHRVLRGQPPLARRRDALQPAARGGHPPRADPVRDRALRHRPTPIRDRPLAGGPRGPGGSVRLRERDRAHRARHPRGDPDALPGRGLAAHARDRLVHPLHPELPQHLAASRAGAEPFLGRGLLRAAHHPVQPSDGQGAPPAHGPRARALVPLEPRHHHASPDAVRRRAPRRRACRPGGLLGPALALVHALRQSHPDAAHPDPRARLRTPAIDAAPPTSVVEWMRSHRALLACLAVLCLLPAMHPGDIQWVGDEPMLIAGALRANGHHSAATHGLTGTAGAAYGPFPTWLYQASLAVSSNLVVLVALRAILMTGVLALSLLWLCRTLGLWPWFIPALLCSPYLWFYARALWDNTFYLPLCALAPSSGEPGSRCRFRTSPSSGPRSQARAGRRRCPAGGSSRSSEGGSSPRSESTTSSAPSGWPTTPAPGEGSRASPGRSPCSRSRWSGRAWAWRWSPLAAGSGHRPPAPTASGVRPRCSRC